MGRQILFAGGANRALPYVPTADAPGIATFEIDDETGAWSLVGTFTGIDNPTYLSLSPDGAWMAATSEVADWREGLVTLLSVDRNGGGLAYRNQQPTRGGIAAQSSFHRGSKYLALVNYGTAPPGSRPDSSLCVYAVTDELGPVLAEINLAGPTGPLSARQDRSHPHCVVWLPQTTILLAADLGLDRVFCLRLDAEQRTLEQADEVALPPGFGPRHIDLHPGDSVAYVIGELGAAVATLRYDAHRGTLEMLAASPISEGTESCSAICVAPSGTHLFVGDRAGNAVALFGVDPDSGIARYLARAPSGGRTPRDLSISSDGNLLAVANQDSGSIALFRHQTGGVLVPLATIPFGTPMCVAFAAV
jgi:6-phosphogluconolactonase